MSVESFPLFALVGRSPSNCRKTGPDDRLEALAASLAAVGQLQPLLVSPAPRNDPDDWPGPFWIDDGGRRYDAFRLLLAAGTIQPDHPVLCDLQDLAEPLTRERSLAANVMRRDLHPVDECDAFEAMRAAGLDVEKIAADFAVTVRQVRQRLRLTTLSPAVRAAWRDGAITTEVAQAMTVGTHAAQDALLIEGARSPHILRHAGEIRSRLVGTVARGDSPEALYLGLYAYVAAGGLVEENLFEDHALILDPALLKRLAREKMMREGEAILATTGYGFCLARVDIEQIWRWGTIEPDFLPDERARLEAIEQDLYPYDEAGAPKTDREARIKELDAEEALIEQRAALRGATPDMRAKAGIFLDLSNRGTLSIEYGMLRPDQPREASAGNPPKTELSPLPEMPAAKPDAIETAGSGRGQIRTILEATIIKALAGIIGRRPDLALMLFVAQHGATWRADALTICPLSALDKPLADGLLTRIANRSFDVAVTACAQSPLSDLTVAFSLIIGHTIRINTFALLSALDPLMQAIAARGAPLRPAFVAAMDYDRFFEAATKAGCLRALELMAVDAVDKAAKKPLLAGQAAAAAKAAGWLPFPLDGWAAFATTSPEAQDEVRSEPAKDATLAEAMDAAITAHDADGESDLGLAGGKAGLLFAAADANGEDDKSDLRVFLERECVIEAEGKVKAGLLFDRYKAAGGTLALRAFGDEIASLEIAKKRTKEGVHYLGIALVDATRAVAA